MYCLNKEKLKRYYIYCKTEEEVDLLINCCKKLTDWFDEDEIERLIGGIQSNRDRVRKNHDAVFYINDSGTYIKDTEGIKPQNIKPLDFFVIKEEKKTKIERPTEKIKENKQTKGETMKNLKNIGTEIVENAKEAVVTSKDAIITSQLGNTGLQAIKTGLKNSPLPENVKALLDTPVYGDAVVGLIANIAIPTITDNEKAKDVVYAMNTVSMMGLSNQFTWIQDIVKNSIESVVGIAEKKTKTTKKD